MSAAGFPVRQEDDEVASSRVTATTVVGFVVGAVAVFIGGWLVASMGGLRPNAAGPGGPRQAPRAISHIEQTPIWSDEPGIDLRNAQHRELESWGWVDKKAGIARIPVARAMDVVVGEESR
jgi:hypothetical protein